MTGAKETSQPEGRPRPERNPGGSARDRTQGRASLPAKLARVNEAARGSRQTRFTALLHHVDEEALLRAFRRQLQVSGQSMAKVAKAVGVGVGTVHRIAQNVANDRDDDGQQAA